MNIPVNIEELINHRIVESNRVEFKADYNPAAVIRTICAFANDIDNVGGGYIVIGVEEESMEITRKLKDTVAALLKTELSCSINPRGCIRYFRKTGTFQPTCQLPADFSKKLAYRKN